MMRTVAAVAGAVYVSVSCFHPVDLAGVASSTCDNAPEVERTSTVTFDSADDRYHDETTYVLPGVTEEAFGTHDAEPDRYELTVTLP